MNNNLTTERSHLGVFSTTSYITVGDQYGKKSESDPRLKGKQFTADFPKSGVAGARPNNSMFDREHKWLYGGEKCVACSSPPHSNRGQARPPDGSQALFSQEMPVAVAAAVAIPATHAMALAPALLRP